MYTITVHEPIRDDGGLEESGATEAVSFWYLGRNRDRGMWGWVGWVPVVVGGLWAFA